jgi:hypothetical protein
MEKYGFVYIWYDRKRKMYYVGSHWGTIEDGYICSSNRMRDAYRRRPQDFKRRILSYVYTNRTDLYESEQRYFDMMNKEYFRKKYYNICSVVKTHWSADEVKRHEVAKKIKAAETGPKISKALKGREVSKEHRKRISETLKRKGIKPKEPHRWTKDNPMSEEGKKAISEGIKDHWKNSGRVNNFKLNSPNNVRLSCISCRKETSLPIFNRDHKH